MPIVIDVHTHMFSELWFELLKQKGAPRYQVKPSRDEPAPLGIYKGEAPFATPQPAHFDYEMRIDDMDDARVDIAIVSLTAPNVFWGSPSVSLKAAQLVNDDMAAAQTTWPDRIRWFASIPWEHKDLAVSEAVDTKPSELLRRIYYDGVTYQQETLEMCIGVGGAGNVMYGSDYPHNIGDMKGCLKRIGALPGGVRNKVRGENALLAFDL